MQRAPAGTTACRGLFYLRLWFAGACGLHGHQGLRLIRRAIALKKAKRTL
jgi:hypothetical protein